MYLCHQDPNIWFQGADCQQGDDWPGGNEGAQRPLLANISSQGSPQDQEQPWGKAFESLRRLNLWERRAQCTFRRKKVKRIFVHWTMIVLPF